MQIEDGFSLPLPSLSVRHRLQGLARTAGQATFGLMVILAMLSYFVMGEIQLPEGFINEEVATGLRQPVSIQFSPDGRLFVAERAGTLRIIKNDQLLPAPFLSLAVTTVGSHGLLGVSFDPNFTTNGYVYILYHSPAGQPRISRFKASSSDPDIGDPQSELVIYEDLPSGLYNHAREIPFGPDGKMYLGGYQLQVLRIDPVNYPNVIPKDNPYPGNPIWATGFRNPSSMAFDPVTGALYANDVGWYESEKIRRVTRDSQTLIYSYDHPEHGGAITGGAFYRSSQFPADYAGSYFFTDHVQGFIKRLNPSQEVLDFANQAPYPIDLKIGPDGYLYYTGLGVLADLGPKFDDIQPNGSVNRIRYLPSEKRSFNRAPDK